ncbi:hypothetical protein ACFXGG_04015 [Streptomyces nigra]|uniref:hypothetical protein n=1 Tax=Streptomyces nigra TaxID=1827580 RepID=UPI0036A2D7AC
MKSVAEILGHFDGRGRVEITLRGLRVARAGRVGAIAYELGYALHSRDVRSKNVVRLHFVRDDDPLARRRAEETRARVSAGGPPLWPEGARRPGPPPPPQPPPPLPPYLRAGDLRGRWDDGATRARALPGGAGGFGCDR